MESDEICIGSNRYRIVGANPYETTKTNLDEASLANETNGQKLDRISTSLDGGDGSYSYTALTLKANEQSYEVNLDVNATQFHMRCDQGISIKLNTKSGDYIDLTVDDFPFTMSELKPNESIHRIYCTTGSNIYTTMRGDLPVGTVYGAIIKIIAIGFKDS